MVERLTGKDIRNTTILKVDKDNMHIYNTTTEDGEEETVISCDAITKLGELEDILEKYNIDSVEELEELLDDNKYTQNVVVKQLVELQNAKIDRDTWKRACELASETLKQVMGKPLWIGGNIPAPEVKDSDYFYQQAKKEQDENKN